MEYINEKYKLGYNLEEIEFISDIIHPDEKKLDLNGCKDKGVSVGEESILEVKTAEIKSTNIGLVAKI